MKKLGPPRTPENSAFPLWILRLEPFLNDRACRNVVYRMFRDRRERLPAWRRFFITIFGMTKPPNPASVLLFVVTAGVLAALIAVPTGLVVSVLLTPIGCCLWIFVPFVIWPWFKQKLARRRLAVPGMPLWISDVLSHSGVHVQAMTDLYMAGLRGPDIIMSIYAEARERTWRLWLLIGAIIDVALISIFFHTALAGAERILLAIPYLFLLYEFLRLTQSLGAWRLVAREITTRLAHWREEVTLVNYIRRGLHDGLGFIASFVIIIILTSYGAEAVGAIYPITDRPEDFFIVRGRTFAMMVAVTAIASFLRFLARVMMDGISFSIDASLKEAHQRYTEFVTTRVLEDSPFIVPERYQRLGRGVR